ncbi:MAG: GSCFA domain-containing protein [Bacteroidota bacterium]
MKFRTEINIPKQNDQITYNSEIVLFGSCFTENIEKHFKYYQFKNNTNSHGILFHPIAIENSINDCTQNRNYKEKDLYHFNELWMSFSHHTKFSDENNRVVLKNINKQIRQTNLALTKASHILITLGTSWVYRFENSDELVANCHKIPQKYFKKELLSVSQIIRSLENSIAKINSVNPNTVILFTVSPVRHLKDGFAENNLSKSHLISAIHRVIDNKQIFYFPSYEIMMDDLRDYRFYKSDMLHPNEIAMEYIWEKFKNTWIDERSFQLMDEIESIQKSLQHKPFQRSSKKYLEFLSKLEHKIKILIDKYPHFEFKKVD